MLLNLSTTMRNLAGIFVTLVLLSPVLVNAGVLTMDQLGNIRVQGIYEEPVLLSDGLYKGPPFVPGGSSRPSVSLIESLAASGDLNGDGSEDAAVLLIENSGGSGVFIYLVVVVQEDGNPVNIATVLIGDRVQLRKMTIDNGKIITDTLIPDTGRPITSPNLKLRTVYELRGSELVITDSEDQGLVSVDDIGNSSWRLAEPGPDPIPPAVNITATFIEGRISGFAGCNNYRARVEDRGAGALSIGPIAATRKMCPQPITAAEDTFLRQLESVSRFQFSFGQLVLAFGAGETAGGMRFEPITPE